MSKMICTLSLSICPPDITSVVKRAVGGNNLKWYRYGGDGWSTYGGSKWYTYAAHGWTTYAGYHWYSLARLLTETWRFLGESGFERLLFDDHSANRFIRDYVGPCNLDAFERCQHPAMRADYFRLCFLMIKGGFYVDADDVCLGGICQSWFCDNKLKLHPLCYDATTDSMVDTIDFITSPTDLPNLTYYVNNNPIIAPPGHPVICLALERSTKLLMNQAGFSRDIQSITGPGNLTASLVRHDIESERAGKTRDFDLLTDWDTVAMSRWPLEYRSDERNWRLWRGRDV